MQPTVKGTRFDKVQEMMQEYKGLKAKNLWFYYDYYTPGERPVEVYLDGMKYILFSTNNYLGLSRNEKVINAVIETVKKHGVGSGASFAVTGGCICHRLLERALADFYGYEEGLVLSSGYMANSAIITSLVSEDIKVFCDKFIHASFRNSLKLHGVEPIRYEHDDVGDLITKLKEANDISKMSPKIIITESLFSQHGTIAKVDQISKVAKDYNAILIVDDAHGLGTIGSKGYGILDYYRLSANDVTVITGAMNKSLGSIGGFILSSKILIEQVKMKAHELIFTSSLPAITVAASLAALTEIRDNGELFDRLKDNISYLRECLTKKGIGVPRDATPIVPLVIGAAEATCRLSKRLRDNGIIAIPIIPPAVPADRCLIRIQVTADHTHDDIDKLVSILEK